MPRMLGDEEPAPAGELLISTGMFEPLCSRIRPAPFFRAPRSGLARKALTLLVLLAQVVVGTAWHHHSNRLLESLAADDATGTEVIHEIVCQTPNALHWHADRTVEIEPCLACLRQHLVGVEVHPPVHPVLRIVEALRPAPSWHPIRGISLDLSSRGPPVLL